MAFPDRSQDICPTCNKPWIQHTMVEFEACKQKSHPLGESGEIVIATFAGDVCPTCGKTAGEHSAEEIEACAKKQQANE